MKMTRKEKLVARKVSDARIAQAQAETAASVATGICPLCGAKLKRNLSLAGWWQCEQYGSIGFRARDTDPQCSWQGFTSCPS